MRLVSDRFKCTTGSVDFPMFCKMTSHATLTMHLSDIPLVVQAACLTIPLLLSGRRSNNILAWSRYAWLTTVDVGALFQFFDDFLPTPYIPANTVGLFRINSGRFIDNNENWAPVNNHNGQRVTSSCLRSEALCFNYIESRMLPINGIVFTKRVIRRGLHPGYTLVHYLRVPQ
ncbi:unnamed protein product [Arabidopsis thaliana]|uniref:(thale cress) hypothetical protein n=1 Tax=Arabidopsis thaliana TaxID=3702 RepID=A0A7G2FFG0_ARATH|nr:unnamed protein product [Arabidopsis thaliana]